MRRLTGDCAQEDCQLHPRAKGLCAKHYRAKLQAEGRLGPRRKYPARTAEMTLRTGGRPSPPLGSPFRVLARTCPSCGELITTPDHLLRKASGPLPRCYGCFLRSIKRVTARWQAQTLDAANHYGEQWTGPEMELVLRGDLSDRLLALQLGRTINGVRYIRRQLKSDPRYIKVAGVVAPAVTS